MGCYPWFVRPVTPDEFELMKEYCIEEAYHALMRWKTESEKRALDTLYGIDPEHYYHLIVKSCMFDMPCLYGKYWYQLGWGSCNPKLSDELSNFKVYWIEDKLYTDIGDEKYLLYVEELRVVKTYPHKVIHNKKELRRYLRKKYFSLSEETHKSLSNLWAKYPGSILYWA